MKLPDLRRPLREAGERIREVPGFSWLIGRVSWVSATGWAVLISALLLGLLAERAGWVEAHVLAIMCLLLFGVATVWVFIPSPHAVRIRLPKNRIVAGQSAVGEIEVRNTRRGRSATGVVELPVGAAAVSFVVPSLEGGGTWSEVFSVVTRKRGVITIGPARTVRSDSLGLLRRVRTWSEPEILHVHPRTVRVPFDATGALVDVEGVTTARLSSSDVSFHALREYVPGDDRRNVHWPTTARLGKLIVRVFEETRRSHHLILLDTDVNNWEPDEFEVAVSLAASLALSGVAASRKVSFATSNGWVSTTSPMRMLDDLAELENAPQGDLLGRLREVQAARPDISVATILVSRNTSDEEIARLGTAVSIDTRCGVLRVKPGSPMRRRRFGGTKLVDCPSLDDLARIIGAGGLS